MGEQEDPLTLKFTGIDNETTSEEKDDDDDDDEEEEEDGKTDITMHASDVGTVCSTTNSNYLTVNPTFGKMSFTFVLKFIKI